MERKELYATITAMVAEQIEAGAGTWRMPWHAIADAGEPVNALTRQAYRGGNHLIFGMMAVARGWGSGYWGTYKQFRSMDAQVRRGERATHGVKWSPVEDRITGERRLVPFCFAAFNSEQVTGWEAPEPIERDTPERIADADTFFSALGADVRHGNRAAYVPSGDYILLPDLAQFDRAPDYYATSAHEHAHWTGDGKRLARDLSGRFGTDAYAAEELIAELSAAFTCARLGISTVPRPDHAAYLSSWLRVLRADTSALFHAASKAQAATDFLAEHAESTGARQTGVAA